jgi:hypothetical protein
MKILSIWLHICIWEKELCHSAAAAVCITYATSFNEHLHSHHLSASARSAPYRKISRWPLKWSDNDGRVSHAITFLIKPAHTYILSNLDFGMWFWLPMCVYRDLHLEISRSRNLGVFSDIEISRTEQSRNFEIKNQ